MEASTNELHGIVSSGWDGLVGYIRQLTQCELHVLNDVRTNRISPINAYECDQLGILYIGNRLDVIDTLTPLVDYVPHNSAVISPATAASFTFPLGKFAKLDDDSLKLVSGKH